VKILLMSESGETNKTRLEDVVKEIKDLMTKLLTSIPTDSVTTDLSKQALVSALVCEYLVCFQFENTVLTQRTHAMLLEPQELSHSPMNVFVKHKQVSAVLSYFVAENGFVRYWLHLIHDFLGLTPSVVCRKRHLDRFSHCCTAHPCVNSHTDTHTTLRPTSVAVGRFIALRSGDVA